MERSPVPKLLYSQPRLDEAAVERRFIVARHYMRLTHALVNVVFPGRRRMGQELDNLIVLLAVFIGDAEGRPMSATKLANFTEMPRATLHRRLDELMRLKKIVRRGRLYHYAENAMKPDSRSLIDGAVNMLCGQTSKMDGY